MHARVSGLADYFAVDELDGIRLGRQIVRRAQPTQARPGPAWCRVGRRGYDPEHLLGIPSADPKVPFDPRDVIARLVDDSDFDEFKPLYGSSLVTGFAELHGYPIGILANHRGVLFSEEATRRRSSSSSPTRSTRRSCSCRTPPATWSARSSSSAASSKTARR